MVGAVLTQNTNWANVEKAIANLKKADVLSPQQLHQLDFQSLAQLIKPAGYYNIKSRRLKNLVSWFYDRYEGAIERLGELSVERLREELLAVKGVGRETADSIILYALNKPTFVVDTYTFRMLYRHGCIDRESDYETVKDYCQDHLPREVRLYNEFHALIVQVGKKHCKPRPQCEDCPLARYEHTIENGD